MSSNRILIYKWKAYNYPDIIETFQILRFETDIIEHTLKSYDADETFTELLRAKINANTYKFIFTVNFFPVISDVCSELGLPYLCWTCDNPLISMYHESVFNDVNRIFTFDKTNVIEFKGMGVKHIYYLPLAVDSGRLQSIIAASKSADQYKNDVCFVGRLYDNNSYDQLENILPEYLRGYFDGIMQAQSDLFGSNIIESALTSDILEELSSYYTLDRSPRSFSDLGLIFSVTVLGFKTAQMQRKENLLALSKILPVTLYSDRLSNDLITVENRGELDYWTEAPLVYNDSKINLNFTIPNIKSGIPLRVWDILGAGGFCMTNYQAELSDYFKNGDDLVWFYSKEDLIEKAKWYHSHDYERERIAANGLKKVREHNYIRRISKMMEIADL